MFPQEPDGMSLYSAPQANHCSGFALDLWGMV
jgi:hypothetical protein